MKLNLSKELPDENNNKKKRAKIQRCPFISRFCSGAEKFDQEKQSGNPIFFVREGIFYSILDDNQNYCGGYGVQFGQNKGRCGICGDPWNAFPRQHEAPNGIYATGIITKTYKQGSFIPVIVDITANHQGHFIFKLCPNNDIFQDPEQDCCDEMPLWVGGGDAKFNNTR